MSAERTEHLCTAKGDTEHYGEQQHIPGSSFAWQRQMTSKRDNL